MVRKIRRKRTRKMMIVTRSEHGMFWLERDFDI